MRHLTSCLRPVRRGLIALAAMTLLTASPASAGLAESPALAGMPRVDAADFFMFRSYEAGRQDFVTLIANYNPLQDPFGGPVYFPLDADAFYDIHIINDNDEIEDLTFRFRVRNPSPELALTIGPPGDQKQIAVPLANIGPVTQPGSSNFLRSYTVKLIRGDVRGPASVQNLTNSVTGSARFGMPLDNIGTKSIPNYDAYADGFIYPVEIPGCGDGRVFVGQRREPFQGDIGGLFDLANLPGLLGDPAAKASNTAEKNVTTLALEVPTACLVGGGSGLVAGWTSARLPRVRTLKDFPDFPTLDEPFEQAGDFVVVSRLGNPLVNELLIGFPHKDYYNASHPRDDEVIVDYVTHPALPQLLEQLLAGFGVQAPTTIPRLDLIVGFMTGLPGLNEGGPQGEVMRLNSLIPPKPAAEQNPLGVVGGDLGGYPNGRRPGDDVVDNSLRVLMGFGLPTLEEAPSKNLPFTDGVPINALQFDEVFPYLRAPLPGATGQ